MFLGKIAKLGEITAEDVRSLVGPASPSNVGVTALGAKDGAMKLVAVPDGVGNSYVANFETVDGWQAMSPGTISVAAGILSFVHVGTAAYLKKTLSTTLGNKIYIAFRVTGTPPAAYLNIRYSSSGSNKQVPFTPGAIVYAIFATAVTTADLYFWVGDTYNEASNYTIEILGFSYGDGSLKAGSSLMYGSMGYTPQTTGFLIYGGVVPKTLNIDIDANLSDFSSAATTIKRSLLPDGAGMLYVADAAWTGWAASGGGAAVSVADGILTWMHSAANSYLRKDFAIVAGKYHRVAMRLSGTPSSTSVTFRHGGGSDRIKQLEIGVWTYFDLDTLVGTGLYIWVGAMGDTNAYTLDLAYYGYGDMIPLPGTLTEQGARRALELSKYPASEYIPSLSFNMPPYMWGVVGIKMYIYFENLIMGDASLFDWNVTCYDGDPLGSQDNTCWSWTPDVVKAGTILAIAAMDKRTGRTVGSGSTTIIVVAANAGSGTPKVLLIGDSTTAGGQVAGELERLMTADAAMDVEFVGTKSAVSAWAAGYGYSSGDSVSNDSGKYYICTTGGISAGSGGPTGTGASINDGACVWSYIGTQNPKHEGISGHTLTLFTSVGSPFYIDGAVNFSRYISDNSLSGCDVVLIHIGINDVFSYTSDEEVKYQLTALMAKLEILVDSIQAYSDTCKIGICLTIPPAKNQDAFGNSYGTGQTRWRYKRNNWLWVNKLIANYGGRIAEKIWLIPYNVCIDTANNFPLGNEIAVNAYNPTTVIKQNNGVHPAFYGYRQIVPYPWIKAMSA